MDHQRLFPAVTNGYNNITIEIDYFDLKLASLSQLKLNLDS